ncbi:MAG: hypothetical protein MJ249_15915 [Kiritimatiellae bacterium]|nr:hypothetical protein [Kiritimatiellia bacterium]
MNITYNGRLNQFYELVRADLEANPNGDATHQYVQLHGENLNVSQSPESIFTTYLVRSKANTDANNDTRSVFKEEIERFFGGHVPESVKTAMKWGDFDGKGRTLSLYRIKKTFAAIAHELGKDQDQRNVEMDTAFASLVLRGTFSDISKHIQDELGYIEGLTPPEDKLLRGCLTKLRALVVEMYDKDRNRINNEPLLEFCKTVEELRKLSGWIVDFGNDGICREHYQRNDNAPSLPAAKALRGLCTRVLKRFLVTLGAGELFRHIGYRPNAPELPDEVSLDMNTVDADEEVARLYRSLKYFKSREDGESGGFPSKALLSMTNPDLKADADQHMDLVLNEVWRVLRNAPPSLIRQLLKPSKSHALAGYSLNPQFASDKNAKDILSKLTSPLDMIILNRYYASFNLAPVFDRMPGTSPDESLEAIKSSFAGTDPERMRRRVCGLLDKIEGSLPAEGEARLKDEVENLRGAVEGAMVANGTKAAVVDLATAAERAYLLASGILLNAERSGAGAPGAPQPSPKAVAAAQVLQALCETLAADYRPLQGRTGITEIQKAKEEQAQNPMRTSSPTFDAAAAQEGKYEKGKPLILYRILKAFYGTAPLNSNVGSPALGDLLKKAVINRYKKDYAEYDKKKNLIEENLRIDQEVRFHDEQSVNDKELDERATKFLNTLMNKWWKYLTGNGASGEEGIGESRTNELLGLQHDGGKIEILKTATRNARAKGLHIEPILHEGDVLRDGQDEFNRMADWDSTWTFNEKAYGNDTQLKDLLAKLDKPIEKIIVSQIFEEFNLPPVFVHKMTGEGLPPMALNIKEDDLAENENIVKIGSGNDGDKNIANDNIIKVEKPKG